MPRRGCEHQVEPGRARLPRFERGSDYLDARELHQIATRYSSEILAKLDADDVASPTRKMPRSLARTASEFQHRGIACESAKHEQVVEDLLRVLGTSRIVR